jgi:hypothetical protein
MMESLVSSLNHSIFSAGGGGPAANGGGNGVSRIALAFCDKLYQGMQPDEKSKLQQRMQLILPYMLRYYQKPGNGGYLRFLSDSMVLMKSYRDIRLEIYLEYPRDQDVLRQLLELEIPLTYLDRVAGTWMLLLEDCLCSDVCQTIQKLVG